MPKRRYTREFKLNVVQTVESSELQSAQACQFLGPIIVCPLLSLNSPK